MRKRKNFAFGMLASDKLVLIGWAVTPTGCWEWNGRRDHSRNDGYGRVDDNGRGLLVHRVAYEKWIGPIEPGLVVMHTCDNRICINPDHLVAGTQAENIADRDAKGHHPRHYRYQPTERMAS